VNSTAWQARPHCGHGNRAPVRKPSRRSTRRRSKSKSLLTTRHGGSSCNASSKSCFMLRTGTRSVNDGHGICTRRRQARAPARPRQWRAQDSIGRPERERRANAAAAVTRSAPARAMTRLHGRRLPFPDARIVGLPTCPGDLCVLACCDGAALTAAAFRQLVISQPDARVRRDRTAARVAIVAGVRFPALRSLPPFSLPRCSCSFARFSAIERADHSSSMDLADANTS